MTEHTTRRGPGRIVQWVLLLGALGLGLEGTTRLEEWVRFRTPLFNRYRSEEELMIRAPDGFHGRRHASFEKWSMNNLGYRGPDADSAKTPGRFRIVAMGASEMFGLYESPGMEVPRQLEDSVRARLASTGCQSEVWNGALPGMALPSLAQELRLRTTRYAPDVVVIYPSPPFYLEHGLPFATPVDSLGRERELPFSNAIRPRVLTRLRAEMKSMLPVFLATWLRNREVAKAVQQGGEGWRFDSIPADRLRAYEADLRKVVGAARATGATPVLATHGDVFWAGARSEAPAGLLAAWEKAHPRATGRVLIAFDSAARVVTLAVAADSALEVAEVAEALAATPELPYADYVHFTDHGAAIVAGALAGGVERALAAAKRIPCR